MCWVIRQGPEGLTSPEKKGWQLRMATKRRHKARRAWKQAQQQRHRPAQRVQEAVVAFTSGDVERALALAMSALTAANDAATCAAAQHIVIEARFRAAATTTDLR